MRSKFKRVLAFAASLAMCGTMLLHFPTGTFDISLPVKAAEEDVEINADNFPDETFRSYVDTHFDTTDDGILDAAELAAITEINLFFEGITTITDLTGVEYFTELTILDCSQNQLTSLDVSQNTALLHLGCHKNQLTSLDVSGCTELTELSCYSNKLTTLDVSGCTELTNLNCYSNKLTSLNLSGCTQLTSLNCDDNQLTTMDISDCSKLENLRCSLNKLTSLDTSNCAALKYLDCSLNPLRHLDMSKNTELSTLDCARTTLTHLDVSGCTELTKLLCYSCDLTSLDISQNTKLTELSCHSCELTSLDISQNTALNALYCYNNPFLALNAAAEATDIDTETSTFTANSMIIRLEDHGIDKTKMSNLSGCSLHADGLYLLLTGTDGKASYTYTVNSNISMQVSIEFPADGIAINEENFPDATFRSYVNTAFDTTDNDVLDAAEIAAATEISVNSSNIATLEGVGFFTALTSLKCAVNHLTALDLQANTALTNLDCSQNNLTALDLQANIALTNLNCSQNSLTCLDLSKQTLLQKLNVSYNELTELDLQANTALTWLECNNNKLTELDLTQNTQLLTLYCMDSSLIALKATSCTMLNTLYCYNNTLSELDLRGCVHLQTLMCSKNNLTSLLLDSNKLTSLDCSNNLLTSLDLSSIDAANVDLDAFALNTANNISPIALTGGTFDVSALSGFPYDHVLSWTNAALTDTTLSILNPNQNIKYTYDCGNGIVGEFEFQPTSCTLSENMISFEVTDNYTYTGAEVTPRVYVTIGEARLTEGTDYDLVYSNNINAGEATATIIGKGMFTGEVSAAFHITPKPIASEDLAVIQVPQPVPGETPLATLPDIDGCTEEITWTPADDTFRYDIHYAATITLTPDSNHCFTDLTEYPGFFKKLRDDGTLVLTSNFNSLPKAKIESVTPPEDFTLDRYCATAEEVLALLPICITIVAEDGTTVLPITWEFTDADFFSSSGMSNSFHWTADFGDLDPNGLKMDGYINITNIEHVAINAKTFPDDNFRSYVLTNLDIDGNTVLTQDEIEKVTKLILWNMDIASLKGIGYFTQLQQLYCQNNPLTMLDVSDLTHLELLDCSNTQILSLDVSGNTSLTTLYCCENSMTFLNVSGCTALTALMCDYNQLTSLDVSTCTALTILNCRSNQLTSLDVSACTKLETLLCENQTYALGDIHCEQFFSPTGFDPEIVAQWKNAAYEENEIVNITSDTITYYYTVGYADVTMDVTLTYDSLSHTMYDEPKCVRCGSILINETSFPDAAFRDYVSAQNDANNDGYLSPKEVAATVSISVAGLEIADLTGIHYFTELNYLNCYGNQLTELVLDKNTKLTALHCFDNQLTTLDVSNNTALTALHCYGNELTTLDVSSNTALTALHCFDNQLTKLDVSSNTALTTLDCYNNQLTKLDVSSNTALTTLDCSGNALTTLDVSSNTALTTLHCQENPLWMLDLPTDYTGELVYHLTRELSFNQDICTLPVSGLQAEYFTGGTILGEDLVPDQMPGCVVYRYPLTNGENLEITFYFNSAITDMFPDANFRDYISNNIDTNSDGYLSTAELDSVTALHPTELEIASLEGIQYFTELSCLLCYGNNLTELDVSQNQKLTKLYCYENELITLNLDGCTELELLSCSGNQLSSLDLSGLNKLTEISCSSNLLTTLDLSDCQNLIDLRCMDNALSSLNLDGFADLTMLKCYNNNLTTLNLRDCTALQYLECGHNQLTSLDLRDCTALQYLECGNNQLTSLDLRDCTALETVYCDFNQLTSLDVSGCTALTEFDCENNQLWTLAIPEGYSGLLLYDDVRTITPEEHTFTLPLDNLQAAHFTGGTLAENRLTAENPGEPVIYQYPLANGETLEIQINLSIPITETCFPDANFRSYISSYLDDDQNGCLSYEEYDDITFIDVSYMEIASLAGIEYFTNLETLYCNCNQLTDLDLSKNTWLTQLDCEGNVYDITLVGNTFDLSTLPETFDLDKVTFWINASADGNILTVDEPTALIGYTYDTGYQEVTFYLQPTSCTLTPDMVAEIENQYYTGDLIEPPLTILCGDTELTADSDYTAVYDNNVEVGTASVTIVGIGFYQGDITMTFEILEEVTTTETTTTESTTESTTTTTTTSTTDDTSGTTTTTTETTTSADETEGSTTTETSTSADEGEGSTTTETTTSADETEGSTTTETSTSADEGEGSTTTETTTSADETEGSTTTETSTSADETEGSTTTETSTSADEGEGSTTTETSTSADETEGSTTTETTTSADEGEGSTTTETSTSADETEGSTTTETSTSADEGEGSTTTETSTSADEGEGSTTTETSTSADEGEGSTTTETTTSADEGEGSTTTETSTSADETEGSTTTETSTSADEGEGSTTTETSTSADETEGSTTTETSTSADETEGSTTTETTTSADEGEGSETTTETTTSADEGEGSETTTETSTLPQTGYSESYQYLIFAAVAMVLFGIYAMTRCRREA